MRYSTRKKIVKASIILGIIAVIVLLGLIVIISITRQKTPLEKKLVPLEVTAAAQLYPYEDGIVCIDQNKLKCFDTDGALLYSADLIDKDMKASRHGDNTILWNKTKAQIYDENGEMLLQIEPQGDIEIVLGRCGQAYFVIATIEEGQNRSRVYNYESEEIDLMLYPDESIIDLGFFGDSENQLWALLLDSHGTLPICQLRTVQPGKSMTGSISVTDQICYDVAPLENNVYTIGTHHIQSWTYTSVKQSEQLVYGWTMQDYLTYNSTAKFLMGPSENSDTFTPLSALWYIGLEEEQYRISMPAGIIKAVLTEDKIYAISNEGVYDYRIKDFKRTFSKMPFYIDDVAAVIKGKAFVLRSSNELYLISVD